ncbi:MAG: YgiQ family radical SAM protein [Gammaproteobacteria bacterium]|nr:YgiQ family radical SAM protein [Gammaproteobacteria bacterium]
MLADTPSLFSRKPYWAKRFGVAYELPMSRAEMDKLGWDSCDIIIVTGDAYIDHPSFGMAVIGRLLESQGFRVGIIAQPDMNDDQAFMALGEPNLYFGITAGNMDSMVNNYTADKKIRHDDAYTPDGVHGKRPDRAVIRYTHKIKQLYKHVPTIIGGIEASLRRIAHFDYWSEKIRHSIVIDTKADLLLFGNAERALIEVSHRLAKGEKIKDINNVRGTAFYTNQLPKDWAIINSSEIDNPGTIEQLPSPYEQINDCESKSDDTKKPVETASQEIKIDERFKMVRSNTAIRIPSFDQVIKSKPLYAHASRVFHLETNPGNARALIQQDGERFVWLNPPPIPLETDEMDAVFDMPFTRRAHSSYGDKKVPAWEMIRFSVNIMRGCFGGCTFCSITEHEGRIIQSRSEKSVIKEIESIRDTQPEFTGHISDVGGPTANMYHMKCKNKAIEESCRRLSCIYPSICKNMDTDHSKLISLYRKARSLKGIKKINVASGLRYDLAVESPEYIQELVTHHVGGYLKIAPEHTEQNALSKMMKPGIGTYDKFKALFDKYSKLAGKEQYLIPYFISAHPGTTDVDMMNLSLWLKKNKFRIDQVQAFIPTPLAIASAMYHSGKNPLKIVNHRSENVKVVKGEKQRRLHKAFLRYHDPDNWPILREALKGLGRADLIGNGKHHLVPSWQPKDKNKPTSRPIKSTKKRARRNAPSFKFNKKR